MRRSDHNLDTPRGEHWTDRALCRQLIAIDLAHPDDWYPVRDGQDHAEVQTAKRRCGDCRVRAECLDDAIARDDQHGIAGGLTARERRAQASKAVA